MKQNSFVQFVKSNLSAIVTFVAGVVFLVYRLAFPDIVSESIADVLLLIALPMFILIFTITFKLDEQKKEIQKNKEENKKELEEIKNEIFETIGYRFRLFQNKEICDTYYENMLTNSKIVKDLTWAEVNSQNYQISKDYLDHIKNKQEYQELFIFSVNAKYRIDRLMKLKEVYNFIKSNPNVHVNYSCSYYDELKFERLQYTIFDEKEVLFTSSYAQRCSIEETALVSIFNKYFDQAWKDAKVLIENGLIVDEKSVENLLSKLTNL
jgi:hypothetical protein